MMYGNGNFSVTSINGNEAQATSGETIALLEKREDGWYDLRIRIAENALAKLEKLDVKICDEP
jgi:hypothetical protein